MNIDLPLVWAAIIALAVLGYVVLDGFDLGLGILFPFATKGSERDAMMNSVAPVWDGNETWLVLGGGGLYAVFPLAYAVILPALYVPITVMLLALVFRGVAFEFRWKTVKGQWAWDLSFAAGSTVAAFAQGIALGALVQGIPVAGRAYAGGWWDWLTPFSLLTGVALVVGYALLGACWLIFKTEGQLQAKAFRFARITALATLGLIGVVSAVTPFLNERFLKRWYSWPDMLWAAPVPILVALCAYGLLLGLTERRLTRLAWMPLPDVLPFWSALGLFVLSFVGLVISFFPYIVPSSVTIWDAAAPNNSLSFLLVGTVFLLPLILIYTAYSYWVFRGKVDTSGGYH